MGDRSTLGAAFVALFAAACGAPSSGAGRAASDPSAPDTPSPASKHSPPAVADPATPPPSPSARAVPPIAAADDDDPTESSAPIVMPALVEKGAHAALPKGTRASTRDKECWQSLSVSGKHQADYDNIVSHCGAPTGMIEYVKPVTGHLHHVKDRRDTFRVELRGGLCYRYFAVADAAITDLDILVETTGGALVASDQLHGPIAIIDAGKPWCQAEDTTLDFHIQVGGSGSGKYAFGIWARPKP